MVWMVHVGNNPGEPMIFCSQDNIFGSPFFFFLGGGGRFYTSRCLAVDVDVGIYRLYIGDNIQNPVIWGLIS